MLTQNLDIPNKPQTSEGWSIRKLFSFGALGKVVSLFNPFEFTFFIMVLISGLAEILGKHVSWFWYVILFLVLLAAFASRTRLEKQVEKPAEKNNDAKITK